jgi:chromosome segregation ATPase
MDGSPEGVDDTSAARTTNEGELEAALRVANEELKHCTEQLLEQPLVVLTRQRNRALSRVEELRASNHEERERLIAEQDAFIAFLMDEHSQKLEALDADLGRTRDQLSRIQARATPSDASKDRDAQILVLEERLNDAFRQVDEARSDALKLQQELDEVIRVSDEAKTQAHDELSRARDDIIELESKLDEAQRRVEDERDATRDEAYRFNEQLDVARRELDERREEVRRLRERLATLGSRQSVPPPSMDDVLVELEEARIEARRLRKQLIDAKREQQRAQTELEEARRAMKRRDSNARLAAVLEGTKSGSPQD